MLDHHTRHISLVFNRGPCTSYEMALIEGVILTVTVLYLLYKYGTNTFNRWKDQGIPHKKPIPFIGNSANFFTKKNAPNEEIQLIYNAFPDSRCSGHYMFQLPILVIRDLHLIKEITVKDFDHFSNRNALSTGDSDPLFGKNLLSLKDQKWRDMRNTLSPVFTAAKMKNMFQLVDNCAQQLTHYLDDQIKNQIDTEAPNGDVYEADFKKFFSVYANDVIATTAFGVQVDSLKDPSNDFFKMGLKVTTFQKLLFVKFMIILLLPKLAKWLKIQFFGADVSNFFRNLVHGNIKMREEQNIVRPDLIHLLMQARKGALTDDINDKEKGLESKKELSDDDITAQALLFFLAGFDTTSTVLAFAAYELALHPEIQEKVHDEIQSVIQEDGEKLTYDAVINKMKYLNAVIYETLRKWPPAFFTDRRVSKPYVIPETSNEPKVTLNVDDIIWIPVYGIHRDPKYFPDPEKFDPERFSEENSENIVPFSFFGFGQGPRNCIGMRFALMETKACLAHLVRKFQFVPTAKTKIPIRLDRKIQVTLSPEGGFMFGVKRRP